MVGWRGNALIDVFSKMENGRMKTKSLLLKSKNKMTGSLFLFALMQRKLKMDEIQIIECFNGRAFGTLGNRMTITYFTLDLLEEAIEADEVEWER